MLNQAFYLGEFMKKIILIIVFLFAAFSSACGQITSDLEWTTADSLKIGNTNWFTLLYGSDGMFHFKHSIYGLKTIPDTNWVKSKISNFLMTSCSLCSLSHNVHMEVEHL